MMTRAERLESSSGNAVARTTDCNRRRFLSSGAAMAALAAFVPRALADTQTADSATPGTRWRPSERYPDPAIEILDPSFEKYRIASAGVERLGEGFRWAEGPVWMGDARCVLFSDIPGNRIMKWDEATGALSVYREPSNNANGNTRDRQGRFITCEQLERRVTRTEYDGSITTLADRYQGKRFNSPNDVISKSDGSIWFTDPPFGLNLYEGAPGVRELARQGVYRVDGNTGAVTAVIEDMAGPNGLCFSPDESVLYVIESRARPNRLIWAYDVTGAGARLGHRRMLIDAGHGTPDGMRCDEDGNLWCGWGMGSEELDGVMVFSPAGKAIGRIRLPERCANVCFGGAKRNRLFMAACHSFYSLFVNTRGATKW
jgi:gluconolactonase